MKVATMKVTFCFGQGGVAGVGRNYVASLRAVLNVCGERRAARPCAYRATPVLVGKPKEIEKYEYNLQISGRSRSVLRLMGRKRNGDLRPSKRECLEGWTYTEKEKLLLSERDRGSELPPLLRQAPKAV